MQLGFFELNLCDWISSMGILFVGEYYLYCWLFIFTFDIKRSGIYTSVSVKVLALHSFACKEEPCCIKKDPYLKLSSCALYTIKTALLRFLITCGFNK